MHPMQRFFFLLRMNSLAPETHTLMLTLRDAANMLQTSSCKIAKRYCVETVLCTDEGKPCSSFSTTDSPNFSVLETYSSGRCSCMRRSWNWHLSHSVASTTWCLVTPLVFSSFLPRTRCTSPTARTPRLLGGALRTGQNEFTG